MPGYFNNDSGSMYLNEDAGNAFSAIYKGLKDFRQELAKTKAPNELKKSSIMRASKDMVMSFPVICSDAVEPATAMMLNKAIERQAVSAVQILFSALNLNAVNAFDAISQLHSNLDNQMDISDYMDYVAAANNVARNRGGSAVKAADSFFRMGSFGEEAKLCFQEQCRHTYPESSFNESSLNDYIVESDYQGYHVRKQVVTEAKGPKYQWTNNDINNIAAMASGTSADHPDIAAVQKAQMLSRMDDQQKKLYLDTQKALQDELRTQDQKSHNKNMDRIAQQNYDLAKSNMALANAKNNLERKKLMHQVDFDKQSAQHNYIQRMLLPSDAQKINELVPTMIVVRYQTEMENGAVTVSEAIAGVKAHLYVVPSEEVITKVGGYKKNSINQLNLIRATTKEISMSKDFVGAIKDARIDAKDNSLSKTSPIWRMLQARSASSNINRLSRGSNNAMATSTIVLTAQESDYIKSNYRVNMDNANEAIAFMAKFNLMSMVIVNEQTEVAKFIMDGDRFFTSYTFTSLERENKDSVSNRTIINLLSKMNR